MKASWLAFKKRNWESRSLQERKVLKLVAWLLTPVLVYVALWQPAHKAVQRLKDNAPLLHMQAERLRIQADEVEMLRHRPKPALLDAGAMKTAVEESASRHNLREAISTLDLQEPNALRLSMAAVSFEQWLRWMQAMQQEQHIRADSVSLAPLPQAGMVKISATLINGSN